MLNWHCRYALGIYFHHNSISMISLRQKKERLYLQHAASSTEDIKTDKDLGLLLKNLAKQMRLKSFNAYISIANLPIIQKTIAFDCTLTEQDIILHLESEQNHYFQDIEAPLCFDFTQTEMEEKGTMRRLNVFAANKQLVDRYMQILKIAKLKPICLEPKNYALLRTLPHTYFKSAKIQKEVYLFMQCIEDKYECIAFNKKNILFDMSSPLSEQPENLCQQCYQHIHLNYSEHQTTKIFTPTLQKFQGPFAQITKTFDPWENIVLLNEINLKKKQKSLYALGSALRGLNVDA